MNNKQWLKTNTRNRNGKYLTEVSEIFSKPQKHHCISMMESLIGLNERRTISRINENVVERCDISCDIKFTRENNQSRKILCFYITKKAYPSKEEYIGEISMQTDSLYRKDFIARTSLPDDKVSL